MDILKWNELTREQQAQYLLNQFELKSEHFLKRSDILLNTICGGSIFIIFQFIKEIGISQIPKGDLINLIFCGIGFTLAILVNFYSIYLNLFSYESHITSMRNARTYYREFEIFEKKHINDDEKLKKEKETEFLKKQSPIGFLRKKTKMGMMLGKTSNLLNVYSVLIMTVSIIFLSYNIIKYVLDFIKM